MPLSYSDIMSLSTGRNVSLYEARMPHTGYNATLYEKWLPYAAFTSLFSGAILILSLFLPWFSEGNILTLPYTGFQIASSGAPWPLGGDTFSFPWLWLLPIIGSFQIVLSVFPLWELLFK